MNAVAIGLLSILILVLPPSGFSFDTWGNPASQNNQDSRFCLGCHDGTIAPNIISQDLRTIWGNFGGEMPKGFCLERGHPVGIDYQTALLRSKGRLKQPSLFDAAVRLENGQVSCTSCHDPNSQLPKKLVMQNSGSRLCFSCHNP